MKRFTTITFLLCCTLSCLAQNKLSINLNVGRTIGISRLQQTEGYTPYFTAYPDDDLGYDIALLYDFNPKTNLALGVAWTGTGFGVRLNGPNALGGTTLNISVVGNDAWTYYLQLNRRLALSKNNKFETWLITGLGIEKVTDGFVQLGGFVELQRLDYEFKEAWYPELNAGIHLKYKLKNSKIGLRLIGGLGFVYHSYFFYQAIYDGEYYYGVNSSKGDYVSLLLSYEYGFSLKKKGKTKH